MYENFLKVVPQELSVVVTEALSFYCYQGLQDGPILNRVHDARFGVVDCGC